MNFNRSLTDYLAVPLGVAPCALRRNWREAGRHTVREMIAHARIAYAVWLMRTEHCKATAAARLAGFRSYWNANRRCKRYTGRTLGQCRDECPCQLDLDALLATLAELRARGGMGGAGGTH